jgi:transmembrane sensor
VTSAIGVSPAGDAIRVVEKVDVDKVMAWKNGYFDFENVRFEEVMRQLQRWYEIDIVYSNGIPDIPLGGEISRNLKLSDLLKGLEGAGVKFRLEKGRRLVVFQ